jgi:hypothetical protein
MSRLERQELRPDTPEPGLRAVFRVPRDSFQDHSHAFELPSVKHPRLDERQAAFGHLQMLVHSSIRDMEELFVALAVPIEPSLFLPTLGTSHAVGLERKPELFVPASALSSTATTAFCTNSRWSGVRPTFLRPG